MITKEIFRKKAKKKLKLIAKTKAKCSHYESLRNLKKIIKTTNSKKILFFMPMANEPNLLLLRRKLAKSNEVFIPLMRNLSFEMVKLRGPFYKSRFGILENRSQNAFRKKIDLAVVPVIGVDGKMARIGHGMGFYDRFFDNLNHKPLIIFVEICDMYIKETISQKHDIKCDIYLTPKKNYLIRGKNDRNNSRLRSRCSGSWCRISNI